MTTEQVSDTLELRHAATDHATIVVVPERRMFAVDGVGSPAGGDYRFASETLRNVAELLRVGLHRSRGLTTRVGALEAAWWTHPEPRPDEMAARFIDRSTWHWQQMVEIPSQATDDEAEAAIDAARQEAVRDVALVRRIAFAEGRSAQILHVGTHATAAASVRKLFAAVDEAGLRPHGHLHEIHLADPERVAPERQRTILRLPIEAPEKTLPAG